MKTSFFIIVLIFMVLLSCKTVTNSYDIPKDYLIACEPGKGYCKPIETQRRSASEKLTVNFSVSSLGVSLGLYDSTYLDQMASFVNPDSLHLLRKGFVNSMRQPSLDLTDLPDGKFFVFIMGDGYGGIYQLNIETEK